MRKKHLIKLTATHNKKKKENSQKKRNRGDLPRLNKAHVHRTANGAPMAERQGFPHDRERGRGLLSPCFVASVVLRAWLLREAEKRR